MVKNKKSLWYLTTYGIALILFLYFGLNNFIISALGYEFPNARFITSLAVFIVVAWSIGLGVRHYLNNFSSSEEVRNKLKNSFVGVTVVSSIVVLIIFSIT